MNIIPWRRRESSLANHDGVDELWQRFWNNGGGPMLSHLPELFQNQPLPAINIAETEGTFSVTMDCPGLEEADFEVQTMGKQLIISGERKWEKEKQGKEYHRVESQYGRFERSVQLPENARTDPNEINASYNKGVLTVTVPKLEKTPAAKIPVHAG